MMLEAAKKKEKIILDEMTEPVLTKKMITSASEMMMEAAKKKEKIILDEMNELVSRGLLVLEETEPVLTKSLKNGEPYLEMNQKVRVVLKDQEYIESLEKENRRIRDIIDTMRDSARDLLADEIVDYEERLVKGKSNDS